MNEQDKFDRVIMKAENAFWTIVHANYKHIDSDSVVSAETVVAMHKSMKETLAEFIDTNS